MSKNKILEENVLTKTDDGRIIPTTAVLSVVSGGKAVNYIDEQGFIVKTEVYSRSPYYMDNKFEGGI